MPKSEPPPHGAFPTSSPAARFAGDATSYLGRPASLTWAVGPPRTRARIRTQDEVELPVEVTDGRRDPGLLVVEADESRRRLLRRLLEGQGYRVRTAEAAEPARRLLDADLLRAVLLAVELPDGDSLDLMEEYARRPGPRFVAMVPRGEVSLAVEAVKRGAADCVSRPLETERLLEAVARAVEASEEDPGASSPGSDGVRGELDTPIIGRSEAIERTLNMVRRVAPTASTVLITGETGTGKELVARAVHELSSRADGPFVPVVCSAVPESLLEAELFGHRKGSFTGAHEDREGLVEQADGGTLFLDEISTVVPDVQVKLLRVLQEREIQRIGGGPRVPVDFRLVAATNVDLSREVEEGRFRRDLYYRLNVFPVRVPPLRERPEDIPVLAQHFRARFAERNGVEPPRIRPETVARMQEYRWPGNVRELEHYVERAMLLHLGEPAIRFEPPDGMFGEREEELLSRAERESWDLDRLEREYILRVLEEAEGNRSRAAEILGVHRRTVSRKLEEYRPRRRREGRRQERG